MFPWIIDSQIVCVSFMHFETLALNALEIDVILKDVDVSKIAETILTLAEARRLSKDARRIIAEWVNASPQKKISGCSDLFVCQKETYETVTKVAHYANLGLHRLGETEDFDEKKYYEARVCVERLDVDLKKTFGGLNKIKEHVVRALQHRMHEYDFKRHDKEKKFPFALAHLREMTALSVEAESKPWYVFGGDAGEHPYEKRLKQLETIVNGLREFKKDIRLDPLEPLKHSVEVPEPDFSI